MAMITLLILSSTILYCHRYLARQRLINDQIREQWIAECLIKMSDNHSSNFNLGATKRLSQSQWQVTLKSGHQIIVTI